ncbi:MAG: hypothetical protein Sapg2KO_13430 [Saprospiraceae bacterium]
MFKTFKAKTTTPTFISNPKGQHSTTKSAEKIRKEHLRWRNELQSKRTKKAGENQLSYWSKMSAAASF